MATVVHTVSYVPTSAQFVTWLQKHPVEERGHIFHVIDSLVGNRERNGNIPPLAQFSFDAGVLQVAPQIRSYLVAVPPRSLLTEVQRLAHLRPPPTPAEPDPLSMSRETQPQAVAVETLMRDRDHTFKSIITDYSHFLSVRDQYVGLNDKRGRTAVPDAVDFPIDVAGERKLVEELFGAMLDFGEVIDEQRQRRSKKRKAVDAAEDPEMEVSFTDSTHVRRVKEASNLEIELLAWDLVFATRDAQNGRVAMAPWGPEWHYDRFDSFKERFERVKYACKHSKSTVNGLMTGNFVQRLAAAPDTEYKRKVQNRDINRTRDAQVKAGIQALKSGKIHVSEDLSLMDPTGQTIAPGPPGSAQLNQERRRIVRHRYSTDAERTARLPIRISTEPAPSASAPNAVFNTSPAALSEGFNTPDPPESKGRTGGQAGLGTSQDGGSFGGFCPLPLPLHLGVSAVDQHEGMEHGPATGSGGWKAASGPTSHPSDQYVKVADLEDMDLDGIDWSQYADFGTGEETELDRQISSLFE